MLIYNIIKASDSSQDEFESAINCAKDCIVSVLDNDLLSIVINGNSIIIDSINQKQKDNITFSECKEKVKGCFCDASGKVYPEFAKIELKGEEGVHYSV